MNPMDSGYCTHCCLQFITYNFRVKILQIDSSNKNTNVTLQYGNCSKYSYIMMGHSIIIQYGKGIKSCRYNNNCNSHNNSCSPNLPSTAAYNRNCYNKRRLFYL